MSPRSCTIALLSGVSQAFILRELSWQSRAISSVAHSARQRSLDHSLSVFAMAIVAASEPGERGELEGSLRNAIQLSQRELSGYDSPGAGVFRDQQARFQVLAAATGGRDAPPRGDPIG